jgi:hypothetical protein
LIFDNLPNIPAYDIPLFLYAGGFALAIADVIEGVGTHGRLRGHPILEVTPGLIGDALP